MDTEGLSKLHCIRDMNELERDSFFTLTKKPKNGKMIENLSRITTLGTMPNTAYTELFGGD